MSKSITPFWECNKKVDSNIIADASEGIGVDFSFFSSDSASKITLDNADDMEIKKKKSNKKVINGNIASEENIHTVNQSSGIADVDYAKSYNETNNLIRKTIAQADTLSDEIRDDIEAVRSSKTIKNKYTYVTNLTTSASNLLATKISAIKELNSSITQAHNLELNRLKTLKINETDANDDMRMMDLYSSFINTPIGTYSPNVPTIQDITVGVNSSNSNINAIEMPSSSINNNFNLSPEQNRMRMESNPNIQVVVRYDQSTGQRCFDVIDKSTGVSVPNYPRPDSFLLEDTTIDVHSCIARNRNINAVWPLILDGYNSINEY